VCNRRGAPAQGNQADQSDADELSELLRSCCGAVGCARSITGVRTGRGSRSGRAHMGISSRTRRA
jgi:hypothetical protein